MYSMACRAGLNVQRGTDHLSDKWSARRW